jgi:hypothetical protein
VKLTACPVRGRAVSNNVTEHQLAVSGTSTVSFNLYSVGALYQNERNIVKVSRSTLFAQT